MNKVEIAGRIANELEVKKTKNNISVIDFNVAVECGKGDSKHPVFINCLAWRNQADFIEKYFNKGDQIIIVGSLDENEYEKNGNKIHKIFIQIEEVYFGAKKMQKQNSNNTNIIENKNKKDGIVIGDEFITSDDLQFDNDDLPF